MSEIVVGLDLSPSARAALHWAAEQARATGQTLRAVHVTHVVSAYGMALGMGGMAMSTELEGVEPSTAKRSRPCSTLHSQMPVGT